MRCDIAQHLPRRVSPYGMIWMMSQPALDPAIAAFYRDRYDEDQRLTGSAHGQLEFVRTQELLRRQPAIPSGPWDGCDTWTERQ